MNTNVHKLHLKKKTRWLLLQKKEETECKRYENIGEEGKECEEKAKAFFTIFFANSIKPFVQSF